MQQWVRRTEHYTISVEPGVLEAPRHTIDHGPTTHHRNSKPASRTLRHSALANIYCTKANTVAMRRPIIDYIHHRLVCRASVMWGCVPLFTHAAVYALLVMAMPVCCLIHVDDGKIFTQRCAPDRIIIEFIHVTHRKGIVNLRVALYCYRHLYRCDTPASLRGTILYYQNHIEMCADTPLLVLHERFPSNFRLKQ